MAPWDLISAAEGLRQPPGCTRRAPFRWHRHFCLCRD